MEQQVKGEKDIDLEILRHSASHIMAQAVKELYPEAKLGIGPAIADGFYYDFAREAPFTPEDLAKIEEKMRSIIKADLPFLKSVVSRKDALDIFTELEEPYKLELLREIEDKEVTIYQQGSFTDLCRGPHLKSTGEARVFKLLNVAGAYWRGDERNVMLQRIYGTAFPEKEDLEKHLKNLEEAKKRDHRKLGRELGLFSIEEDVGLGLVLWHPRGAMVRKVIEDFWRDEHLKRGYELVYTPHIARSDLWRRSGHLDYFQEMMYPPMKTGAEDYLLKPMNCPFHIKIYKHKVRSYRELPIRYAELGTVYRYERSGVLHGLLRVRGFTQDDSHVFCTPEQLGDEIIGIIDLTQYMLKTFGYEEFETALSVRDPARKGDFLGDDEGWERAEASLSAALEKKNISYARMEGEATFYGPKIDIKLIDALGRGWQGPTIQLDFNLPSRLDVTYTAGDGKRREVVMIHRTVLGTMERFIGGLVEHYAGSFPTWLAPVQVRILTLSEKHEDYAREVLAQLEKKEIRAEIDSASETISYKVARAEREKIPYMLVVGDKEAKGSTVSVRERRSSHQGASKVEEFIARVEEEIKRKGLGERAPFPPVNREEEVKKGGDR
ncbi:threonine--tRNA ligase [candidate division NPL-UPA2 bacterium]|nr:threonine--tRNA ligase [candidate division NPL-UPA2 bacterium]